MEIAERIDQLKAILPTDRKVGFVPTMGALHDGHISLVRASKERGLFTVASIFVNPTQFNDPADFEKYPIDTETDLAKLRSAGCDLVFLPKRGEIYASDQDDSRYIHDFGALEQRLEGAFRPGHFRGVGQVVHILFDAVEPDVAFFGEKDFQQLQVIRKLVEILARPIEIVGIPTVREADGLAMSSRNRRLDPQQRESSTLLFESLEFARKAIQTMSLDKIREEVSTRFTRSETLDLEYFDIIDPATFLPRKDKNEGVCHAVIAAYCGEVRLIDNMLLD